VIAGHLHQSEYAQSFGGVERNDVCTCTARSFGGGGTPLIDGMAKK
jgi:hypothetical protein